jgi:hypothetical protein
MNNQNSTIQSEKDIIEELQQAFNKYKNSYNKKEIIGSLIENEDIRKLLKNLLENRKIEIIIFLLENLSFNLKEEESKEFVNYLLIHLVQLIFIRYSNKRLL